MKRSTAINPAKLGYAGIHGPRRRRFSRHAMVVLSLLAFTTGLELSLHPRPTQMSDICVQYGRVETDIGIVLGRGRTIIPAHSMAPRERAAWNATADQSRPAHRHRRHCLQRRSSGGEDMLLAVWRSRDSRDHASNQPRSRIGKSP